MYWRIGSPYRQRPSEKNKAAFREVVKHGPPPGLLAFDGGLTVGWRQRTPRDELPWLDRTWRLGRVDDLPVWSLSCFYVRKGYRKRKEKAEFSEGSVAKEKSYGRNSICSVTTRH